MERQMLLDKITDQLVQFQRKIGILNKNGLNDANIYSEKRMLERVTAIYGFKKI